MAAMGTKIKTKILTATLLTKVQREQAERIARMDGKKLAAYIRDLILQDIGRRADALAEQDKQGGAA